MRTMKRKTRLLPVVSMMMMTTRMIVLVLTLFSTSTTAAGLQLQSNGTECRLLVYIPFSDLRKGPTAVHANKPYQYGYGNWPSETSLAHASISLLAAAELARKHFNERNPILVPQLAQDRYRNCPVQIPDNSLYRDSGFVRTKTVGEILALENQALRQQLLEQMANEASIHGNNNSSSTESNTNGDSIDFAQNNNNDESDSIDRSSNERPQTPNPQPSIGFCAVVGPQDANAHAGLSVVTEHWGLPQLAYSTTNHLLSRSDLYPNFIRVIPDAADAAPALAYAAQRDLWKRDFVAIIYEPEYGEQFEDAIETTKLDQGIQYQTENFALDDEESLDTTMFNVAEQGFRTIMLTMNSFAVLDDIARVADRYDLVGEGYLWIITGDALPDIMRETLHLEAGSPLDRLLDGAFVFTNYDLFYYQPETDPFLQVWEQQNTNNATSSFLSSILAQQPTRADGRRFVSDLPQDYFQTTPPAIYASFLYDSIMATGLAACNVLHEYDLHDDHEWLDNPKRHYEAILNNRFNGASGPVHFQHKARTGTTVEEDERAHAEGNDDHHEHEHTRDDKTALYGMHNLRSVVSETNSNLRRYESVLVATYNVTIGKWERTGAEMRYAGGATTEPKVKITVKNYNYLGRGVQIKGLAQVVVALLICGGSAAWIYAHRQVPSIKASQPEFLYLLCFGSGLVAISLIFLSFDEDKGWSQEQLSQACAAFPWFFLLGYAVSYTALVCKMWRLSQLLQMSDATAANIRHVLLPFGAVTASLLIVLAVWQGEDPLQWRRERLPDDPRSSYGECQMEKDAIFYLIPLGILILLAMSATAFFSWQLRDVRTDLAESRWIFVGIFGHLQVWAIGIPLFLIADDSSRDASYTMTASLCFMFSSTLVACVIWPKIFAYYRSGKSSNFFDTDEQLVEGQMSPKVSPSCDVSLDDDGLCHEGTEQDLEEVETAAPVSAPVAVDTVLTAEVRHASVGDRVNEK